MDCVSIELGHLISSSESSRLVTLGVCRHLDGVEASWPGDLLKEACEKTRAICEWLGARHLRSGVRATLVKRGVGSVWNRSKCLDLPRRKA